MRSYEELVRRYERLVGRVLYLYARREISVEDLVQETFLRAYDRLETFNPDYRFKTWLLAIANNLGVDTLRRWGDRRVQPGDARRGAGTRGRGPRRRPLQECPGGGGDPARDLRCALILRYSEGLSYAEIAEVLDITIPGQEPALPRQEHDGREARRGGGAVMSVPRRCDPETVFELADGALGETGARPACTWTSVRRVASSTRKSWRSTPSCARVSLRTHGRGLSVRWSRWRCLPGR